ncbi:MAG TPA: transglutaminase-like domain-containing protein [Gammaproteobacteria bacterium]|nr:transglutaminase-like domain-containing protein [Gammaproteobacteria bacterium]
MTPAGWTGLALLLWGQASGQLALVLPCALLIELAGRLPLRFEFEAKQFERCADGSSLAFAALALYQFKLHGLYGIYAILALMPWCLVPLTLMQTVSTLRLTPLAALVYSLRRAGDASRLDLRLPLGLAALLATSAGELPREIYASGIAILLVWLLWARRPRARRLRRWGLHLALAAALAVGLQAAYLQLHLFLGELAQDWFRELNLSPADAERSSTAIGSLRRLKLSDRIFLRVRATRPPRTPLLLTEATYTDFRYGSWSNPRRAPVTLDALPGARRWPLVRTPATGTRYTLALTRARENGVVPLPPEAREIEGPTILELRRLAGDALSLEAPRGFLRYTVISAPGADTAQPPTPADLALPAEYRALMQRLAAEAGISALAQRSPRAASAALEAWFARHFSYSLVQPNTAPWRTPLATFLTLTRRGHCEYFASATVLLLRAAGIPARYAVGYAIDEYSALEEAWLARARDAHAWAIAWIDGRWQVVDTTPARWAALEDAQAPAWQAWFDAMSWLAFQGRRLQAGDAPALERGLLGLAFALAAWLLWRQRHRLRKTAPAAAPGAMPAAGDSPVTRLFESLARRGHLPAPGETTARFLRRRLPPRAGSAQLETLIALHYRARFGAHALTAEERRLLEDCVAAYLAQRV